MSDYKIVNKLSPEEVDELKALMKPLKFTYASGSRRRGGVNGPKALSIYYYSKWFDWNKSQRENFRKYFLAEHLDIAVQGWFTNYPKDVGFLDTQTVWVDADMAGTIVATALNDNQTIILGDKTVTVRKGETIMFSLFVVHAIPKANQDQLWACLMVRT